MHLKYFSLIVGQSSCDAVPDSLIDQWIQANDMGENSPYGCSLTVCGREINFRVDVVCM